MRKSVNAVFWLLVIALAVGACAPTGKAAPEAPVSPAAVGSAPEVLASPIPTGLPGEAVTATPPVVVTNLATPTVDGRLKPEDWREWAVTPAVSARAREIYQRGLALGNDAGHFSKIGDCQSIREVLMGMFDRPGFYALTAENAGLAETITAFAGSFNRDGQGVQGGFNAAAVLSPLWANPEVCKPGETPLACEYRIHRPAIVLISLEVWWDGRTPERYEAYMRRILDYLIERGSLPVLSTKADNVEGDHAINLATARLAYEYDLPLWNWWRAAQALPSGGLDPSRPDGFHLDESAWAARSYSALAALDAVWRGVRQAGDPGEAAQVAAPTHEAHQPVTAPTPDAMPPGLQGRLVLGLMQRQGDVEAALGIRVVDLSSGARWEAAPPGYRLQSVAADGRRLLASAGEELSAFAVSGGEKTPVSDRFSGGANAAVWLPDGSAAYILEHNGERLLVHDRLDGSGWRRLSGVGDAPVEIYSAADSAQIYWGDAAGRVFVSTLEGITTPLLQNAAADVRQPQFAAAGLAFRRVKSEEQSLLVVARADGTGAREAPLPGDVLLDFRWSPDGKRISALLLNRSAYSGRWLSINHFIFTPADFGTRQLPKRSGLNPLTAWSGDGTGVALAVTQAAEDGGGYGVQVTLVDLASGGESDLSGALGLRFADFTWVDGLAWLAGT